MSEPPVDMTGNGLVAPIVAGSRVRLSGGYFIDWEWLHGRLFVDGTVVRFIAREDGKKAAVVCLDEPLPFEEGGQARGRWAVLNLRHVGATWVDDAIVHVELYPSPPEGHPLLDRRRALWVEAAATCRLITS